MKKLRNAQLTELPQTVEIERKKLSTEATLVKGSINYCELYFNRRTNLIITSASSKEIERLRERLLDFNSVLGKSVDLSPSSSIMLITRISIFCFQQLLLKRGQEGSLW